MAETEVKPDVQQKKRKRTGKEREERKRAAIQAKLEAEAAAAAGVAVEDEAPEAPEPEAETDVKTEKEEEVSPTVDFDKIAQRIPAGLKKLHPVFKQAKKAETMRLIKKIRFLKSKSEDVSELEAQLNLLSVVQLHALATTHLRQKLKKHHKLKHIELPSSIVDVLPVNPSVPSSSSSATPDVIAKVENRLCSSKQVADALKPVVSWVLCEPGATLKITKGKEVKTKAKRAMPESESEDESEDEGIVAGPLEGLDSDDEVVMEDKAADAAGWESGSVGGDDESDGEDADSDFEGGLAIAPPSDSESESEAPPKKKAKAPEPKPAPQKKEKKGKSDGTSSMFLPSLAAGFAVGDGDSDPDMDYDEDGIIGSKKAERKNRRGQRARQAIWEKKYGKNAKHVVKAREESEKKRDEPAAPAAKRGPAPRAEAPKSQKEVLHPSWEAAKMRKQRAVAKDAPKPTKIVFD